MTRMGETVQRILIVEDEAEIRRFVRMALGAEGFEVIEADSVQRGLIEAGTRRPDLVVLDLGLPDGNGVELIRDLRAWSDMPVLVLSARTTEADKINALDAGADDYLVKPFSAGELLARVRAQLRRRTRTGTDGSTSIEFGDVRIDLLHRSVERAGAPVHLTPIQYRLLVHLAGFPHCVRTHRQLLNAVWGSSHGEDTPYLRVYMGQLRKKVEIDPSQPRHLLTEAGVGYRFVP
jgi:two-component system, OmpR family, KDP operon response regulator KdpE